nr:hypothetical protein Iba_chr09eCG12460 [Ipomoea batatas]
MRSAINEGLKARLTSTETPPPPLASARSSLLPPVVFRSSVAAEKNRDEGVVEARCWELHRRHSLPLLAEREGEIAGHGLVVTENSSSPLVAHAGENREEGAVRSSLLGGGGNTHRSCLTGTPPPTRRMNHRRRRKRCPGSNIAASRAPCYHRARETTLLPCSDRRSRMEVAVGVRRGWLPGIVRS